jgi:uncharacterized damage-inducible protein DinB
MMISDDFTSLYDFNRWANERIVASCGRLSDDQYVAEPCPGWSSVRSTLVHVALVEVGWLGTLAGEVFEGPFPTEADVPTLDDAVSRLDRADRLIRGLLPQMTPEVLATPRVLSRGGRNVKLAPWVVLRHVVNHSTYHRGQISSKLGRFGIEAPSIDLFFWALERSGGAMG